MKNKINILVVDDEQIVLDSIKKHLRHEEDYIIFTALNVAEALDVMKSNPINIILTDLMMPDIDGLEFLKILKDKIPDVLAVMITGYATINTALQAMQLGAFDYIAKPFTRDELKKIIRRAADYVNVSYEAESQGILNTPESETEKIFGSIKGIGEHSWLMKEEDGSVIIGVERPFLYSVGKIQTVYLPSVGDELRQGSVYFQVFSSDLRSQSLLSPLSGTVIEINEIVSKDPNTALQDPYGSGWLIRLLPSNFDEEVKLMGR